MDNYDNWKQETPENLENECSFCGEPCKGRYCDNQCKKAYEQDN